MAIKKFGNIFEVFQDPNHPDHADHFLFCAPSNLRGEDNMLLATGGLILELPEKVRIAMGSWVAQTVGSGGLYFLRCVGKVGLFQNQSLVKNGVSLNLVSGAAHKLKDLAMANPDKTFALESPHGLEPLWLTASIYQILPDNVTVWVPDDDDN